MKVKEKRWIRFRIHLVGLCLFLGLGVVLARAYQLQVIQKDRLGGIARNGYIWNVKLPPERGTIYDRERHELAVSIKVKSLYAHPKQVKGKDKTARSLSKILGLKRTDIRKRLNSSSPFVWIRRKIPPKQAKQVDQLKLPGVGLTTETQRYYPGRDIAAHVIGFAGQDNQGLEGLERKYDSVLRGPQHKLVLMRDALGRVFSMSRPAESDQGLRHLVLTIDKDIQYRAQAALRAAVKKTGGKAGHCLVVDPRTGEILAMAVVPEFNPNTFRKHKPYHWRNRIVTDCFEPGSTIKAFLLSAALEESAISLDDAVNCEGGRYAIGGSIVHDTHDYDVLSAAEVVVKSSNIGAIKIGCKLGYGRFYDYLASFGFGSATGIDLPGERKGFIRPPKKARLIDQATHYFGQGMTVTSLQLAMAMAAIANGGKLMRPYVVKSIVDSSGNVLHEGRPKVVRRVISSQTSHEVAHTLQRVTEEEGTAPKAAIAGFSAAGKTGTAQKVDPKTRAYSKSKYVAAFVGFTPVVNPRLVILVVVDEPKGVAYGGVVAAPVFSEVGRWCLTHMRVNPQSLMAAKEMEVTSTAPAVASGPPAATDVRAETKKGSLPDFRGLGMREVLARGRSLGLDVVLVGTGLAVKQHPRPGGPLQRIGKVEVTFRPPG
ncbi:MAG: transpeptidase family protein [Deltaproteobacteria bacterium]|nr:transpeptidase family protein [Deltaproteobacteria bacterium]